MSNPADKASLSFTPAPIPAFEAARLQDLYALKILDTAAEERFGRYTRLVAENQLAEAYLLAVEALARLRRDGLSRHDAVHAIGSVLAEHLWTQTQGGGPGML